MSAVEVAKQLFLRYGADWVLWLLGGLSALSLGIIIERLLFYRSRGGDLRRLAERLDTWLCAGEYEAAVEELRRSPQVAAHIAAAGLRLRDRGPEAVEKAMESAAALERARLERWLAFLGTLGNNAPFIGLFGTVVGVVHAFEELGHGAPGHGAGSSPATQVASQAVMASISEALVATAVGLLVALPAVAFYNYFQRRVTALLGGTEVLGKLVLAYLAAPQAAAAAGEPEALARAAGGGSAGVSGGRGSGVSSGGSGG